MTAAARERSLCEEHYDVATHRAGREMLVIIPSWTPSDPDDEAIRLELRKQHHRLLVARAASADTKGGLLLQNYPLARLL